MKFLCFLLSVLVAVMGGLLVYGYQAGQLPFAPEEVVEVEAEEGGEIIASSPLISSQIDLINELVSSLQKAHDRVDESRLQLDRREQNLEEKTASYQQLRKVVESLMRDLETQLIKVDRSQQKNFKTLSGVYGAMEPDSAARSLKHMDPERVALILNQMDSRSMAAVMDAAVSGSTEGGEAVAQWSDAIRRLNEAEDGV